MYVGTFGYFYENYNIIASFGYTLSKIKIGKMGWATSRAIFFTNSSGHSGFTELKTVNYVLKNKF
jgi:hypothetical protein